MRGGRAGNVLVIEYGAISERAEVVAEDIPGSERMGTERSSTSTMR
jgi:hypothetical protein